MPVVCKKNALFKSARVAPLPLISSPLCTMARREYKENTELRKQRKRPDG